MLLAGFNHVATLTNDSERLHAFYRDVFAPQELLDQMQMFAEEVRPKIA